MTLELSRVFRERLITRSGDGYFQHRFDVINNRLVNLRFASIDRLADQKKQEVTFGHVLSIRKSLVPSVRNITGVALTDVSGYKENMNNPDQEIAATDLKSC